MDNLSNSIFTYWQANLQQLPPYKQFHFASRLYLWEQNADMRAILDKLRPWFTADNDPSEALCQIKSRAVEHPDFGSRNAFHLRQPFFQKYPKLTEYIPVLLQIMYLRTVYDIDCRSVFNQLFLDTDVRAYVEQLLRDSTALAALSSQAINFLYTWAQLDGANEATLKPEYFLDVGKSQDNHDDPLQLQLLIYFYTHCIIGASQFYYRHIPETHLSIYNAMADELEAVIEHNFENINLDNKFEFLVCCSILGRGSQLRDRIRAEAEASISSEGTFLIDRVNKNPQSRNTSFEKSEHRNVLFLLSERAYKPLT